MNENKGVKVLTIVGICITIIVIALIIFVTGFAVTSYKTRQVIEVTNKSTKENVDKSPMERDDDIIKDIIMVLLGEVSWEDTKSGEIQKEKDAKKDKPVSTEGTIAKKEGAIATESTKVIKEYRLIEDEVATEILKNCGIENITNVNKMGSANGEDIYSVDSDKPDVVNIMVQVNNDKVKVVKYNGFSMYENGTYTSVISDYLLTEEQKEQSLQYVLNTTKDHFNSAKVEFHSLEDEIFISNLDPINKKYTIEGGLKLYASDGTHRERTFYATFIDGRLTEIAYRGYEGNKYDKRGKI